MSGLDYVREPVQSTQSWHNNKWHRLHSPQPSLSLVTADNPQSSLIVLRGSSQMDMCRCLCLNHSCRPGQRPPPHQPGSSLQDRLGAPLGALRAGQWPHGQGGPAQGALLRAGESAEELRMKEERLEQERAAQRQKEAEARRKAEVHFRILICVRGCMLHKRVHEAQSSNRCQGSCLIRPLLEPPGFTL